MAEEHDTARHRALEEEQKRLEAEAARVEENAARVPSVHNELEQDRIVRPRLLPGDPFVPRKKAQNEEGAE